jgi:16S rRNA (adenine1518-N6/adenine1519-N6)-dimethyltransferase
MSAVIHIVPKPRPKASATATLEALTAAAFGQRRRCCGRSLKGLTGALEALEEAGIERLGAPRR